MSAPMKPWERPGVNQQNLEQPLSNAMSSSNLPPCCQPGGGGPALNPASRAPPPIPTRPTVQSTATTGYGPGLNTGYNGMGGYGGFGGYGGGMYGGYGNYGYSGMGYGGYNRFGYGGEASNNSFVQVAEESSRPAFQSIENIVQAVTSVSMMLDSTYQAVYNSFRAVLGVADNFSRMKTQLTQVLSALAFVRTLRYFVRKIMVWLGLRSPSFSDDAWSEAADEAMAASNINGKKSKTNWPILMFFGIILGGPWLIWKLVSSVTKSATEEVVDWATGQDDHVVAQAEFSFTGGGNDELSFKEGDKINVAPRELQPRVRGWLLASVDGQKVGYVPANYVKILGKRRGRKHQPPLIGQNVEGSNSTSQSQMTKPAEQKSCCNSKSSSQIPANQSSSSLIEEKLDSVFDSEMCVKEMSDPCQMEAAEVLESQTGD